MFRACLYFALVNGMITLDEIRGKKKLRPYVLSGGEDTDQLRSVINEDKRAAELNAEQKRNAQINEENSEEEDSDTMPDEIVSCDFEIFGEVQGVFFRKYTRDQARLLNLRGYCMNTVMGSVKGHIEGDKKSMKKMQNWLKTQGSPRSRIDNATFTELQSISEFTTVNFEIKK